MGNDMSREGGAVDEVTFANGAVVGDIRVMEQLLAHKPAILYARSRELNTVWHYAAQGGHVEVLDWLAEVAPPVHHDDGEHAVQEALKGGWRKVKHAMKLTQLSSEISALAHKLSLNQDNRHGQTPLMLAAQAGHVGAVRRLLQLGADSQRGDTWGSTAAHFAALYGQADALQALVDADERLVKLRNHAGLTPLHFAAWSGAADTAKLLLSLGASLCPAASADSLGAISCNAGATPLHLAAMRGELRMARLLLAEYARELVEEEEDEEVPPGGLLAPDDPRTLRDRFGLQPRDVAREAGAANGDMMALLDPATPLELSRIGSKRAGVDGPGVKREQSAVLRADQSLHLLTRMSLDSHASSGSTAAVNAGQLAYRMHGMEGGSCGTSGGSSGAGGSPMPPESPASDGNAADDDPFSAFDELACRHFAANSVAISHE